MRIFENFVMSDSMFTGVYGGSTNQYKLSASANRYPLYKPVINFDNFGCHLSFAPNSQKYRRGDYCPFVTSRG